MCPCVGPQFLHGRNWKGLEQRLGETGVSEPAEEELDYLCHHDSHEQCHSTKM